MVTKEELADAERELVMVVPAAVRRKALREGFEIARQYVIRYKGDEDLDWTVADAELEKAVGK